MREIMLVMQLRSNPDAFFVCRYELCKHAKRLPSVVQTNPPPRAELTHADNPFVRGDQLSALSQDFHAERQRNDGQAYEFRIAHGKVAPKRVVSQESLGVQL